MDDYDKWNLDDDDYFEELDGINNDYVESNTNGSLDIFMHILDIYI